MSLDAAYSHDLDRLVSRPVAELYFAAYDAYQLRCFWSTKKVLEPKVCDIQDACRRLKRDGDMSARRLAVALEKACNEAL
jgi:hypothetical protein